MNISEHLGRAIVEQGMALIEDDARTYGSPADVTLAKARMYELIDKLAEKTTADAVRKMTAHKLGDLIVGILHSGDHSKVLSRALADIVSVAPVVDLQERKAAADEAEARRQEQTKELERQIEGAIGDLTKKQPVGEQADGEQREAAE